MRLTAKQITGLKVLLHLAGLLPLLWLFWAAPIAGALLGAAIYGFIGKEES